ncbi:hypothetical protein DBR46_19735 [Pseudomonas sp. KBW05]|nr:hypothetical protein DBR46_19735 [Pseudomonas sp. KBW05]
MWERACSRMRWVSQHILRLTHRIREQARSHIFDRVHLIRATRSRSQSRHTTAPPHAAAVPTAGPGC